MKTRFGFLLSLPLLLSASHAALAAATPEEAARLTTLFQSYLGAEPGVVKVEADGDDYSVTLDMPPSPPRPQRLALQSAYHRSNSHFPMKAKANGMFRKKAHLISA